MSKLAQNESVKLLATFFNNCAVGIAVGSVFIPILFDQPSDKIDRFLIVILGFVAAAALHVAAQWNIIYRLKD